MDTAHNINYQGLAHVGPSIAIWNRVQQQMNARQGGVIWHEEFDGFGGSVTNNVGSYASRGGWWTSYEDTGATVAQLATEVGGVLKITTDNTDNDEVWLSPGSATSVMTKITSGSSEVVAYECRVRATQIVTQNAFFGLSEEGLAAADTVSDAGAFASKDMIGFNLAEAASATMTFAYRKAVQALTVNIAALKTIVAATWYKFGFLYDGGAPISKRIRVFVDGEEQSTYVTATNIAAATFPSGEELNPLIGLKNGAGAITQWDVDWIRVGYTA
jgi:hypothetical protein